MKTRVFQSRAMDLSVPKVLRSQKRLEKLHARAREEQARLLEKKLEAERAAGLRV